MSNVTRQFNLDLNVYQLPNPSQVVLDADTGERLQFYRANSLSFSITFSDGSGDFDMSSVGSVSLEVKQPSCSISPPRPLAPLQMYKEVEGPFSTGTPVDISFDADETAIADGVNWLSVTLYSVSGERMTTVSGTVFVLGNGYGTANVPDVQDLRDQAVQAAIQSCACADRSEAAAILAEGEADRAQDIADNLEALSTSLSYRGEWNNVSAPSGAQRGWFWVIGTAATWSGITWAVGDAALYNGSAWQRVALDWLLAQANANIDSLRRDVNLSKQPVGGIFCNASGGKIDYPPVPVAGTVRTFAFLFKRTATSGATASTLAMSRFGAGDFGGWDMRSATDSGQFILRVSPSFMGGGSANHNFGSASAIAVDQYKFVELVVDNFASPNELAVTLKYDGVVIGQHTFIGVTDFADDVATTLCLNGFGYNASPTNQGVFANFSTFSRALTTTESTSLASSAGSVVPLSARAALIRHSRMDDGAGYQARDTSGNHGLLTATGCTHMLPRDSAPLSVIMAVPAAPTNASYALRAGDVIDASTVVASLIVDARPVTLLDVAQTLTLLRLRLVRGTGSTIIVQRSNGTTHEDITGEIAVSDFDAVSLRAELSNA